MKAVMFLFCFFCWLISYIIIIDNYIVVIILILQF